MARRSAKVTENAAEPARAAPSAPPSAELQQLWFATLRRDWSSLVVIPASPGTSAAPIARALAEIGGLHRNNPVKLVAAEGMDMAASSRLIIDMTSHVAQGGLVIVSIDSVVENQAGIPVALAADGALLCVTLGDSDFDSARRTLELIGQERFLGSVTLG